MTRNSVPAPPSARHVLIVDDDDLVLRALSNIVRRVAPTRTASSAAEAREVLATSHDWLALVVDFALGDGDGLELVTEARRHDATLPALLVTGMANAACRQRAALARAEILVKPFEPSVLRDFVRAALVASERIRVG